MTAEILDAELTEKGYDSFMLDDPDLSDAVVGIDQDGRVVYSYDKMIDLLVERFDLTSREEAMDYVSKNIIDQLGCMGEKAPVIAFPIITND